MGLGGSSWWPRYMCFCYSCGRPGWDSRCLTPAWPSPVAILAAWRVNQKMEDSFALFPFAFWINNLENISLYKCLFIEVFRNSFLAYIKNIYFMLFMQFPIPNQSIYFICTNAYRWTYIVVLSLAWVWISPSSWALLEETVNFQICSVLVFFTHWLCYCGSIFPYPLICMLKWKILAI